jgi:hypothetical protein
MMDWTSRVIEELCRSKAAGVSFEEAWTAAMLRHKPGLREQDAVAEDLFDDARASRDGEPFSVFLRRVCADAWHGWRPELRGLAVLMDADVFPEPDAVLYQAAPVGKHRTAA